MCVEGGDSATQFHDPCGVRLLSLLRHPADITPPQDPDIRQEVSTQLLPCYALLIQWKGNVVRSGRRMDKSVSMLHMRMAQLVTIIFVWVIFQIDSKHLGAYL